MSIANARNYTYHCINTKMYALSDAYNIGAGTLADNRSSPGMPFPGPETGLAVTIDAGVEGNFIRRKIARPGAS